IIQALVAQGATVRAYDPAATEKAKELLPKGTIDYAKDAYDAANGADALLILTEWKEFASLDLAKMREQLKYRILVDGRNLYDPSVAAAAGLIYYSVGRGVAAPVGMAGVTDNREHAMNGRDPVSVNGLATSVATA